MSNTLTNIMKSIQKPPRCKSSARVGNRKPEERARVDISVKFIQFKPHGISKRQFLALQENKHYNKMRAFYRNRNEFVVIERRIQAAKRIQHFWRKFKGYEYDSDPDDGTEF